MANYVWGCNPQLGNLRMQIAVSVYDKYIIILIYILQYRI